MRILTIHSDYIEIETKSKAIKSAEEGIKELKEKECLVVFTSVERGDSVKIASAYAEEVEKVAEQVKTKNIVLYPYVHLTSNPASPSVAIEVLHEGEKLLKEKGYSVKHAPFGWYKAFTLKAKGHPLSELSREIREVAGKKGEKEEVSESLKKEKEMKSRFYIMDVKGELIPVEKFNYAKHENLRKFMKYETEKVRAYEKTPPHIKIMQEHELVDYEPGTDPGNFRWYPKGRLVKKLLERWITDFCVGYGAMEVETPLMYDYEHPALKKYLNRFPARQYVVKSEEKEYFLRFAACFGQFLMEHDMIISYKHLPLKMYELTRYSFRREQSGELAGLKRLRAFTMPDMHTLTASMEQAKEEFEKQLEKGMEWLKSVGLLEEVELGFRVVNEFYEKNKEWYKKLVKKIGKPILIEMFEERYAYFITKFEFNFVDSMEKASALTTVQIDVENAETYDISYVDENGEKKRPLILHASLSGSLERVVYALLEKQAMRMQKGEKAMLPVWLSPTQLRMIPVSKRHLAYVKKVAKELDGKNVRYDIDDREETLSKKIRSAEREWVPYVAVVGDKEMESGKLAVTVRESGEKKEMDVKKIVEEIEKANENKPFENLTLPVMMSKRPIFRQAL
ncbi:MAG: threonine--tRNA ligase [Candidatus Anstonellales archaeon]